MEDAPISSMSAPTSIESGRTVDEAARVTPKPAVAADRDTASRARRRRGVEANRGTWSVRVSGNWRITFRFEAPDAFNVNYEDYH
jgi:hypothetical protein